MSERDLFQETWDAAKDLSLTELQVAIAVAKDQIKQIGVDLERDITESPAFKGATNYEEVVDSFKLRQEESKKAAKGRRAVFYSRLRALQALLVYRVENARFRGVLDLEDEERVLIQGFAKLDTSPRVILDLMCRVVSESDAERDILNDAKSLFQAMSVAGSHSRPAGAMQQTLREALKPLRLWPGTGKGKIIPSESWIRLCDRWNRWKKENNGE